MATAASPRPSPHAAALRQAGELISQGKAEPARLLLQGVLAKAPADPLACRLMASAMLELGQPAPASYFAERALRALPDNPDLLNLLGNAQHHAGDLDAAEATLRRAVDLQPRHAPNLAALARTLAQAGKLEEAEAAASKGLAIAPGSASLIQVRASALASLGRADEAAALLLRAAADDPQNPMLASLLCGTMNYAPSTAPRDLAAAHFAFGRLLTAQMPRRLQFPADRFDPERPLRVGLVSPELRRHALMHFLRPLIDRFDRSAIQLHLYQHSPIEDAVSAAYRAAEGVRWRNTAGLTPVALAQAIAEDRVDVLIDGAGHVSAPVMLALHLRPAPVIASWLVYPCTTGLEAVDARIVDAHTDPAGSEGSGPERLVRIDPVAQCYRVPAEAPEPAPGPSEAGGPVTFGSFSAAPKLNDPSLRRFVRVMREVPGSRLVLKNHTFDTPWGRESMTRRLEGAGLPRARFDLLPFDRDLPAHLASYAKVDVALDCAPYAAVTTACEALTMGVPLVTLAHPTSAGRAAAPFLRAVGLADLVADSDDAFVAAAAGLARDAARRAALRRSLRATLLASPLCDEAGWTARFTGALRDLWRERCARA